MLQISITSLLPNQLQRRYSAKLKLMPILISCRKKSQLLSEIVKLRGNSLRKWQFWLNQYRIIKIDSNNGMFEGCSTKVAGNHRR